MTRVALLLALGTVLAGCLAGTGGAGSYVPPPGDCCPQWSPHGTQIVFGRNRAGETGVWVAAVPHGHEHVVPGIPAGLRSRITCGKNGYDRRDRVYADRIDVVAPDCELVHRR
jgi:hypothetical protein